MLQQAIARLLRGAGASPSPVELASAATDGFTTAFAMSAGIFLFAALVGLTVIQPRPDRGRRAPAPWLPRPELTSRAPDE